MHKTKSFLNESFSCKKKVNSTKLINKKKRHSGSEAPGVSTKDQN